MSGMRIGGLATGMDIDSIVGDLMKAERIPLDKMEQKKTWLTWQRDSYREVNQKLFDLKNMAFDMKLQRTFNSKTTTSSSSADVTATASPSASNGSYDVKVSQLATSAINLSKTEITATGKKFDPTASLESQEVNLANGVQYGTFKFYTFDESGAKQEQSFVVHKTDSLNNVLKRITEDDNGVRAFYDSSADKVVLERTETGNFNQSTEFLGAEIGFDGQTQSSFLTDTLQIKNGKLHTDGTWEKVEKGGENAKFTYNNVLDIETDKNHYTLNGITFNFHNSAGTNVKVNVSNNVDDAVDKITKFVEKYNELITDINEKVNEKRYRDYQPLTEKEQEDMSDKQIELWEERAKSGLLKGDSVLQGAQNNLRRNWYSTIDNSGSFSHLTQIGIKTSPDYSQGGKLLINETELRNALTNDPESVYQVFASDGTGNGKGVARRLEESLEATMKSIEGKAGKKTSTSGSFVLGRQLENIDDRMKTFENRLFQVEDRYWSQFTAMEKAIQKLNSQSMYLMQQFGGGM